MRHAGPALWGGKTGMVTLAIESTTGSDLTYQLTKPMIVIGASSDNDVVLRAPGVAPRHLVIQRNGDVYTFLAQSRQVVVLNGERRSRGVLRVGDRLRIGTSVADILGQAGKADSYGPWRAILGDPLTGRGIESPGEPLLYGDTEISVISEHAVRDLFAFLDPGFTSDSYCRATVSSILPLFPRKIETNVHGGVRPCVQCNFCDEVCPAGIYPFLIWKYAAIGKDEEAFRLRPDACIECGLCDYVCPSKISLLDGIRQVKQSLKTAREAHAAAD